MAACAATASRNRKSIIRENFTLNMARKRLPAFCVRRTRCTLVRSSERLQPGRTSGPDPLNAGALSHCSSLLPSQMFTARSSVHPRYPWERSERRSRETRHLPVATFNLPCSDDPALNLQRVWTVEDKKQKPR
ncbi:unnamed protein product [Pleuronectes platessa]|uniref:Uncharacterized protein n=1 Tax=Pleuronectes platessa TaxID=8262 RepID=A0A9N7YAR3_PLEPL|nr:unnamed protein product [Pleuronectes platessa]